MDTRSIYHPEIKYIHTDDKEINRIEKRIIRHLKQCWKFTTAEGSVNIIKSIGKDKITIETKVSDKGFSISRDKLKAAIGLFFKKRTIARKDLEKFSPFTSAMCIW